MTHPDLLVFATRYDDVTERTHGIALRLLAEAERDGSSIVRLLETAAAEHELLAAIGQCPRAIAFYSHGDSDGRILAHGGGPCWSSELCPDLSMSAVFAHACRAIRWLRSEKGLHRARLLIGYECDLMTPANGSDRFWEIYSEVHSFVPRHLASDAALEWIQRQLYDLCTIRLHELNAEDVGLIELIAIEQSRDEILFI